MNRIEIAKWMRLTLLLLISWCAMTFTHEAGHIVGGWMSGATLKQAELRPWKMPFSFFEPNPHPLVTLWSGPILGVVVPLLLAAAARRRWLWFIAYFCLLANGTYLAVAWFTGDRFLDTTKLLEHGAPAAVIATYCIAAIGFGYLGFRSECARVFEPSVGSERENPKDAAFQRLLEDPKDA